MALAVGRGREERQYAEKGEQYELNIRKRYPLLFAAMDSTSFREDVLMTCARALDVANDASLVREAAAYLEEVETKRI